MSDNDLPANFFYPPDRAAWRQWLSENHLTSKGVWLVYYKQATGKPTVPYTEVVDECLCWGWIDSTVGKIDDERYKQWISPRKRGSVWSRVNKRKVEQLIADGLMTDVGLAKINAAKADGSWTVLDPIEDLIVPEDLAAAFTAAGPTARSRWDALSPSARKPALWKIASAKTDATRQKRIREIAEGFAERESE